MERSVSSISRLEAHHMGMEYFWILATTKVKIEEHYCALAYTEWNSVETREFCSASVRGRYAGYCSCIGCGRSDGRTHVVSSRGIFFTIRSYILCALCTTYVTVLTLPVCACAPLHII